MINIANFKVLKGYEHWKKVFMEEEFVKMQEEAGGQYFSKNDSMHKMKGCTLCKRWHQWKSFKMLWPKTMKK